MSRRVIDTIDLVASRVVAIVTVASVPVVLYHAFHTVANSHVFLVKGVDVVGNVEQTRQDVLEAAGLDAPRNVLTCHADEMRASVEELPWVVAADVHVSLRGYVTVTVLETEFFALATLDEPTLVGPDGEVIRPWEPIDGERLPILVGLGAEGELDVERFEQGREILAGLEAADDLPAVREVHYDRLHGFDAVLADGTEVRLGEGELDVRLERLETIWEELASRDAQASVIGLDGSLSRAYVQLEEVHTELRAEALGEGEE